MPLIEIEEAADKRDRERGMRGRRECDGDTQRSKAKVLPLPSLLPLLQPTSSDSSNITRIIMLRVFRLLMIWARFETVWSVEIPEDLAEVPPAPACNASVAERGRETIEKTNTHAHVCSSFGAPHKEIKIYCA